MKEKDYIEEIILKELEELNNNEPPVGHLERFESKLKLQNKKRVILFGKIWKVAAAVIFVLLVINQGIIYLSPEGKNSIFEFFSKKEYTLASVSPEYHEVESYYNNAINVGLNQWQTMVNEGYISEDEQKMMDNELSDFKERYESLQKDLAANPNDDRVINAMLEYYQVKLSVIDLIVNKLKEVKQQNNSNHEIKS